MPRVTVIMGSASDLHAVKPCLEILQQLDIDFEFLVSSAHRTPDRTAETIEVALNGGTQVFICAAGMAAHLAGVVAARTCKPVIGLPLAGSTLNGMDALLSTVQMPAGYPVATVALNGAKNAAWLAAQILALKDLALLEKIQNMRRKMAQEIEESSHKIASEIRAKSGSSQN